MDPTALPPLPPESPWWAHAVYSAIGLIVMLYLVPLLRRKAQEATANAAAVGISARGKLVERLKAYLAGTAAMFAEKRFPDLARRVAAGQLRDADAIKAELRSWGRDLKIQAVEYFRLEGIDLVAELGDEALADLVERAANLVSPFPGKETAVALLKDQAAPLLVERGVEWMRHWTLSQPPPAIPGPLSPTTSRLSG